MRLMSHPARTGATSRQDSEAAGRAPRGSISREDIVAAATGIVTAGGHEEMSVRSLADPLGVAPMPLYRHIRDKDDPAGQFTQGPRYLLQGISSHARTTRQGGP